MNEVLSGTCLEQRDCATVLRPSLFIIIAKSSPVDEGVVWRILKPTFMVPCLGIESSTWNRLTDSWKFFFFFARGTKPLPALWIVSRTWAVDSRTISDAWDLRGDLARSGYPNAVDYAFCPVYERCWSLVVMANSIKALMILELELETQRPILSPVLGTIVSCWRSP